jgi:hypothetical protein
VVESVIAVPSFPDLLAVLGAAATVIGAAVGVVAGRGKARGRRRTRRRLFEDLALGATIGGAGGCLLAFAIYTLTNVIGV